MSVTKRDIASKLAQALDINYNQALSITNNFFDSIKSCLARGENVKLSSFGNFVVKQKSARPGRNPKTGEAAVISARKVVTFKAGPKLKNITL